MDKEFVYEEAIAELEAIVNKLNNGNVSLDDSLALYTRGVELTTLCENKLSEVEKKISIVNKSSGKEEDFLDSGDNE